MGAFIEINDTLQISKEQGFPVSLDYENHKKNPLRTEDFKDQIFSFENKSKIRVYKIPPVRNFLVENINGQWLYWGLIHITEINHDYVNQVTSGKFKIIHIYPPEEMKYAHRLIDRNNDTDFLGSLKKNN